MHVHMHMPYVHAPDMHISYMHAPYMHMHVPMPTPAPCMRGLLRSASHVSLKVSVPTGSAPSKRPTSKR